MITVSVTAAGTEMRFDKFEEAKHLVPLVFSLHHPQPQETIPPLATKPADRMAHARAFRGRGAVSQTICVTRALQGIGKPSTASELYAYMLRTPSVGYKTSAVEPVHNLQHILRSKKNLFTDVGDGRYTLAQG